jgi:predicted ATP-dependent endonuclease of OLD family
MNKLKFKKLTIDELVINFTDGINFISGQNCSGKTTVFNCLQFVLGLKKTLNVIHLKNIQIEIQVGDKDLHIQRDLSAPKLSIKLDGNSYDFRARSTELDQFYNELFQPPYFFSSSENSIFAKESMFEILDFCFISPMDTSNRKKIWNSIKVICGFNHSYLKSIEDDIKSLRMEISGNTRYKTEILKFTKLLLSNDQIDITHKDIIEEAKQSFFNEYEEKESIHRFAKIKLEELTNESNRNIKEKIDGLDLTFDLLKKESGVDINLVENIEYYLNNSNISHNSSLGLTVFCNYLIILSIAVRSKSLELNFPNFIINDGYTSGVLDNSLYYKSQSTLQQISKQNPDLQYIELTSDSKIPKDKIVYELAYADSPESKLFHRAI